MDPVILLVNQLCEAFDTSLGVKRALYASHNWLSPITSQSHGNTRLVRIVLQHQ